MTTPWKSLENEVLQLWNALMSRQHIVMVPLLLLYPSSLCWSVNSPSFLSRDNPPGALGESQGLWSQPSSESERSHWPAPTRPHVHGMVGLPGQLTYRSDLTDWSKEELNHFLPIKRVPITTARRLWSSLLVRESYLILDLKVEVMNSAMDLWLHDYVQYMARWYWQC